MARYNMGMMVLLGILWDILSPKATKVMTPAKTLHLPTLAGRFLRFAEI